MHGEIKLFSGSSNRRLAEAVAEHLGRPLNRIELGRFSDGEIRVEVLETVRGQDAFIIQSLCSPVNDNLMELLIVVDALKRASAGQITAVIPYYGYARQDRQTAPRSPITAKLVADLLTAAGTTRVVGMELHARQITGFFSIPFDHLYSNPVLGDELESLVRRCGPEEFVVVAPDAGGVERARYYSQRLGVPMAIIDKRRPNANVSEVMNIIGDVKGCTAVIVDDIIDTAGTLTKAAGALVEHGALKVHALATHAVLSGPAVERIQSSALESVVVTDTIPTWDKAIACSKIRTVSTARILGEAIERVHGDRSVSSLFTNP
ncbi:MAG: ribose-phosphate pyrophosphokinase [Myxococcota bacterium]